MSLKSVELWLIWVVCWVEGGPRGSWVVSRVVSRSIRGLVSSRELLSSGLV